MQTIELQNILATKKRGHFLTITYRKEINGYVKTTTTTVRLVDYNSIKSVKEKKAQQPLVENKQPKVSNDVYMGNNIIFNKNTGKTRLQVFLTGNPHHKPHSVYEYQGSEITADEWYEGTGKKPSTPTIMFSIDVSEIVMVK